MIKTHEPIRPLALGKFGETFPKIYTYIKEALP
jgi:hypothetical protein